MDRFYMVLAGILACQLSHAAPLPSRHAQHTDFHCSPCAPGFGVISQCNQSEDTVCEPCGIAFHSDIWSSTEPCHPCSRCGAWLYELHTCNATNDVFCEFCAWANNNRQNPDFLAKCNVIVDDGNSARNSESEPWADYKKNSFGVYGEPLQLSKDEAVESAGVDKLESRENEVVHENKLTGESDIGDESEVESNNEGESDSAGESESDTESDGEFGSNSDIESDSDLENDSEVDKGLRIGNRASYEASDDLEIMKDEQVMTPEVLSVDGTVEEGSGEVHSLMGSGAIELTARREPPPHATQLEPIDDDEKEKEEETQREEKQEEKEDQEGNDSQEESEHQEEKTHEVENRAETAVGTEGEGTKDPKVDALAEAANMDGMQDEPELGASKQGGVGAFPILMAIITSGLICFILGFFITRYRTSSNGKHQVFVPEPIHMKPVYTPTATEPPADEADNKPAPVTPEIIYTSHDEPDLQAAPPDVILQPPPSVTKKQQQVRKPMPPIGKYQSPIDIEPEDAELSDELENSHLVFKYVPENTKSILNLGNMVKVMVDCRGSDLHSGPLGDDRRYCLDHFRFRWGADDTRGSEHSVAGKRYAGEIQLVHWNKEEFRTYSEASRYESGLAIIAVFMNVTEEQHTGLQTLLDVFKSIKYKGESVEVPHHYFDPASLLPGNTLEYWTYPGSLTESPYPETVTWLVMREPISVSASQMAQMRSLMRCERDEAHGMSGEEHLVDNFREQSALGDRSVRASFH